MSNVSAVLGGSSGGGSVEEKRTRISPSWRQICLLHFVFVTIFFYFSMSPHPKKVKQFSFQKRQGYLPLAPELSVILCFVTIFFSFSKSPHPKKVKQFSFQKRQGYLPPGAIVAWVHFVSVCNFYNFLTIFWYSMLLQLSATENFFFYIAIVIACVACYSSMIL